MFDIGWSELMVLGALALIVVGPRDLPKLLRSVGQYVGQARGMARDFQRSMDEAAREADIADMKELRETAAELNTLRTAPMGKVPLGTKPGAAAAASKPAAVARPAAATKPAGVAEPATAHPAAAKPAPAPAADPS